MQPFAEETRERESWHDLSVEEASARAGVDPATGLSSEEAVRRRERYGANELGEARRANPLRRFLREFRQPLMYILLAAAVVALAIGDFVDAAVIFAVAFINAVIGFIQESKAENAIAALARTVTTQTNVLRDGRRVRLDSSELVPGDVVILSSGDKVPADLRLAAVRDLQVSEAALTGESIPVHKAIEPLPARTELAERSCMAYAGSLVTFGRGTGIVAATGARTETGRISRLMEESAGLETPLTRKMAQFSTMLLYAVLGLAAALFAVVFARGGGLGEGFKVAVALAVSAIPEGLPAVLTVTLAIGVARMARRHAIIRKLPAVETLGSTTVICSDKTGTLTENEMTVQVVYAGGVAYAVSGAGYEAEGSISRDGNAVDAGGAPALLECLRCGLLCNDSRLERKDGRLSVEGDPTEAALVVSARKAGLEREEVERSFARLDAIPFESEYQYMATLHRRPDANGGNIIYMKGSLEAVLKRCARRMDERGRTGEPGVEAVERAARDMAGGGLRVLAFAAKEVDAGLERIDHGDVESDLVFLGLQGMIDPPRPEAIEAIGACRTAGIQVKMITGDHALTAAAIARGLGLTGDEDAPALTGAELAGMSGEELAIAAEESSVFARVAPEQKLRLVEALQSAGEVVAMTGDGVNDAPALKQADIGVAMGIAGTEVAKEAADMVLTDDNFASIEAAVEEGRTVYRNLIKTIAFILPVNGGEALIVLAGILAAATLPILPVQILWVNMVSSVALSATLAFEPKWGDVMLRPPRRPGEPLLTGRLLWRILAISAFNLAASFGIFEWILQSRGDVDLARTMSVHALVAAETFYLLSVSRCVPSLLARLRNPAQPVAYVPAIGVVSVILLQALFSQSDLMNRLFHTVSLDASQALACAAAGLPVIAPALVLKKLLPIS